MSRSPHAAVVPAALLVLALGAGTSSGASQAPAPAASSTPTAAGTAATPRLDAVVRLVDRARSRPRTCGRARLPAVPPLQRRPRLDRAAGRYARVMARRDHVGHVGPDGSDGGDRIRAAGYRWSSWGENLAGGHPRPADVVAAWLRSPSHCRTLMARYTHTGLGRAREPGSTWGTYWVQVFATPR